METPETNQYMLGMQAINNFYAMLNQAMKVAMPTAKISQHGAYVWRGFQINRYKDLASNQYYCQVYPGDPFKFTDNDGRIAAFTCRELVFQESYKDPSYKPFAKYENILCIKTGDYYYPFQVSLDLIKSRFFLMDRAEQFDLLKNFVSYASEQALIWQHSQARCNVTNESFLYGNDNPKIETKIPNQFEKVETEFLTAWGMQEELFSNLIKQLNPYKLETATKDTDWIRANTNIHNFDFRGYRMKTAKLRPDKFYIRWIINYLEPEMLMCITLKKEFIDQYNLMKHNYFDLPVDQQSKELTEFIKKCLDRF